MEGETQTLPVPRCIYSFGAIISKKRFDEVSGKNAGFALTIWDLTEMTFGNGGVKFAALAVIPTRPMTTFARQHHL
jgi:hypothetical protein